MKQDVSLRQTFSFFFLIFFVITFHLKKINRTHHVANFIKKLLVLPPPTTKTCFVLQNKILERIQNPVSWQVSADGQRMIGHMILRKNIDGEDILGLKIVGGKTLSSLRKGAVIEKVKRGSIADQEGHLKPGKTLLPLLSISALKVSSLMLRQSPTTLAPN